MSSLHVTKISPGIMVKKSIENRLRFEFSILGSGRRLRHIFVYRTINPNFVVITRIELQDPTRTCLSKVDVNRSSWPIGPRWSVIPSPMFCRRRASTAKVSRSAVPATGRNLFRPVAVHASCLEQGGLNSLVVLTEGDAIVGLLLVHEDFAASVVDDPQILRKRAQLQETTSSKRPS